MSDQRTYKMLLGDIEAGGSGGLPDYSEANDGDVLAIENGKPAWAAPGGAGGGTACIRLSASAGFSSGSKNFCYFVYAYQENSNWVVSNDNSPDWIVAIGYNEPIDRLMVLPLPSDDSVGLFLIDLMNEDNIITGDISTTPTTVYLSSGSAAGRSNGAYRIMGNGSYQFVAT